MPADTNKEVRLEFLLISILSLGLVIRLFLLFRPEQYWFDEILSASIARYSASIFSLIKFIQVGEYHPPGYYLLMFYWTRWLGMGEIATRLLSCIFGVLTLPVFYKFCRKLFSQETALWGLFLLAINPLHLEFSAEARPYTLLALVGLLAAYFLLMLWEKRTFGRWMGFIAFNILGLYIHYSYLFILGSFTVFQLLTARFISAEGKHKFSFKEIAMFLGFAGLGFLPWIPTFWSRYMFSLKSPNNDLSQMGFEPTYLENFGETLLWLIKFDVSKWELLILGLGKISLAAIIAGSLAAWKKKYQWQQWFLITMTGMPLVLYFLTKQFVHYSQITARHVLFSVFFLCAMTAAGITSFSSRRKKYLWAGILLGSIGISLFQTVINMSDYDKDHRVGNIAHYIETNEKPGDLILIDQHLFPVLFDYYYKGHNPVRVFFPISDKTGSIRLTNGVLNSIETKYMINTFLLNKDNYQDLSRVMGDSRRVWLIQITENKYFVKFMLENGLELKEVATLPRTFGLLLFERKYE